MKLPLSSVVELLRATLVSRPPARSHSKAGSRPPSAQHATSSAQESDPVIQGYSIDSRTIGPGELFFAIKGENHDGHDFVAAAFDRGAAAAVVNRSRVQPEFPAVPAGAHAVYGDKLLIVDDTLAALQTLGRSVRQLWGKRLVAVTGSAGKTTTKESIAAVLSSKLKVLKSIGNLNNHFGLPLQLLRLEPEHEAAVVELGMNHAGEIAALAALAQPDVGVVTMVAPVHLGFFKSVAEIAKAKYELIQSLPPSGTAILNADDEYVSQFGRDFAGKVVMFGIQHPANVRAETIVERGAEGSDFEIVAGDQVERAHLPLIGRHNIYNALASVAVALEFGLSLAEAAGALEQLKPADKRGEIVRLAGVTIVNDCYNSNPRALESMMDALAGMALAPGSRRIVIAGEMLELGPATAELHRRCGIHAAARGIDFLLGVRGAAREMVEAAAEEGLAADFVETPEAAGEWLARETRPGDLVLLKASRGVRLEKALEVWRSRFTESSLRH